MNLSKACSDTDTAGIYVHIPFCDSKCPYCDFYSVRSDENTFDRYVSALIREFSVLDRDRTYGTVFFGGGTPSVLGGERLSALVKYLKDNFRIAEDAEITVECNPARDNGRLFASVAEAGVNRISLGLQSAVDSERRALGRLATAGDALGNIVSARKNGIVNISVDLMLGIPGQTAETLERSLNFCTENEIPHVSCYMLQIEEGTVFAKRRDSLGLPTEDETAELYLRMCERLGKAGIRQYEVSNFAVPGLESRHNSSYWSMKDYYGIGPSAHSFVNGKRYYYPRSVEEFINSPHTVDDGDGGGPDEYAMLSLRTAKGFVFGEYESLYGLAPGKAFLRKAELYSANGLCEKDDERVSLTPRGFAVSNRIISDFLGCLGL